MFSRIKRTIADLAAKAGVTVVTRPANPDVVTGFGAGIAVIDDVVIASAPVLDDPGLEVPFVNAHSGYDATKRERVTSPAKDEVIMTGRRDGKRSAWRVPRNIAEGIRKMFDADPAKTAANGLPMASFVPPRRYAGHRFTGAELRWIRAHGQAREIARRLARSAPAGALALAALVPTLAYLLCGLADMRLAQVF